MTKTVDALELLTSQHDELDSIIGQLLTVDGERRAIAIGELADKICTHLAAEQALLYPSIAVASRSIDVHAPTAEHESVKLALADVLRADLDSADLIPRVETLHELLECHARWQEDMLFVELAETVPPELLDGLGKQLLAWSDSSRCVTA